MGFIKNIKEEIAMYEDSPEDLCADVFYENVWKDSMLGANILGSVQTVDSVTKEKLIAHLNKFYVPERMVISIGGNFDKDAALEICKKYLALVYGIPKIKKARLESYLFKDNKKSLVYISDDFKTGYQKIITSYSKILFNNIFIVSTCSNAANVSLYFILCSSILMDKHISSKYL